MNFCSNINKTEIGTSLMVQWLRLHLPVQGVWARSLVKDLRFHMLCGTVVVVVVVVVLKKKTLLAHLGPTEQSGPFRSSL